ncbi:MAG: N-acyl homoserine lactonase family protein [Actinobacteria bacterium]|nr:N-acyl homoserine lactonase family protein [Actinomycetota bacterium]
MRWTIRPVCVGIFKGQEKSNLTYGQGHGIKLRTPSVIWVVSNQRRTVLVDTGISDPEWAAKYHSPIERRQEHEPLTALQRMGIEPAEIELVVLSHLHWDHSFNNGLFPNARFLVQRRELQYAIAPLPSHAIHYEAPSIGMRPPWLDTVHRFELLDGDQPLDDGLRVVFLPGHTPGLHGLLVTTETGRMMIASDCISRFESWQGRPRHQWIPSGIFVDLETYYRSLYRVEELADYVLPSHDMAVFEREIYPSAEPLPTGPIVAGPSDG